MRSRNSIALDLMFLLVGAFPLRGQTRTVLVPSTPFTNKKSAPAVLPAPAPIPELSIPASASHTATLATGLPLRVQLDHRYRMRQGAPVVGKLIDPVYAGDHIVIPVNTAVYGTISGLQPIHGSVRTWAILDGDVTPLKAPLLTFNALQLPDGERVPLTASATERTAGVVRMGGAKKKQSLIGKVKDMVKAKVQSVKGTLHSNHKSDMALQFLYGQLPYHPQEIWAGTQFDAELSQPVDLHDANAGTHLPLTPPNGHIPPGMIDARLITPLSSAIDKAGNPVKAVLTEPYFDKAHKNVILPLGTTLVGVVTQAKPARAWGRNGTLRFTFREVKLPAGTTQRVHAQMTAVEGAKGQNVSLDSEGGAHANSDQGKYFDPLVMGMLASNSLDADQNFVHAGVSSNGFGIVGNIIGLALVNPPVTAGFAYYAAGKSITRRWLMRGHEVVFVRNTRMELSVADR